MSSPALQVRSDLAEVAPYVSPQLPARYRMNTNETPYPPPAGLVDEVAEELKRISLNRYPDRDANALHAAIAEYVSWPREGLWIANGSNEVFLHLFLGFGGPNRSTMVFAPTYSLHSLIPTIAGTEVISVRRTADLAIDIDRALAAIDERRPEIVILCSPNNPTGMCEPLEIVEAIAERAPGLVVVDEAYIEFTDVVKSARPLLDSHPNLALVKTFSKAWRLAGVRIGYMLADEELVAALARVRLPYHLSAITQVVGEAALRHSAQTLELTRAIASERDRIVSGLRDRGLRVYPSDANFVLFEVDDAGSVWQRLFERGILVRRYEGDGALGRCLRVTAGLPGETDAFLSALDELSA